MSFTLLSSMYMAHPQAVNKMMGTVLGFIVTRKALQEEEEMLVHRGQRTL